MKKVTLFRGPINNGVHVVLTESGYSALRELNRFRQLNGENYDGMDRDIRWLASETMTFVRAQRYLDSSARVQHYGTLEMMNELLRMCDVVEFDRSVTIPFSNNDEISRTELELGYGYNANRWERLITQVKKARDAAMLEMTARLGSF